VAVSELSDFGHDGRGDPVLERRLLGYFVSRRRADRQTHRPHQHDGVHASAVEPVSNPHPFAPDLATAIGLLLARSALSQMDVPTRASYVMAVVAPEERPAAASITAVPKTFAWAAGSIISGYLLTLSSFGWPLLIGGVITGVYDILLLIKFQKVRPPEEAGVAAD
jgi:predicted MFS family arabinose efflux permease